MQIKYYSKGNFANSIKLMMKYKSLNTDVALEHVGKTVVEGLEASTPVDTGELANGWTYKIEKESGVKSVNIYNNSHPEYSLVEGLEHGHGTGTGGYVRPTHFVSKTMDRLDSYISEELGGVVKDV